MRKRTWGFVGVGLLAALLLAGVVSNYASSHPDGLDSSLLKGCTVNADHEITGGSCPAQQAREHELADSPLADYGIKGVDSDFLSTGLSGVVGVLLTFAVGGGAFWLLRRRTPAGDGPTTAAGPTTGDRPTTAAGPTTGDEPGNDRDTDTDRPAVDAGRGPTG
ncbi:PDGLE domain-containing protein [Micromonospora sp. PLK6-60]|uniref:PDGLE domain-containing protein n=1 Tax=Micromonospora sp. PLK6-60 TaxID=2873383 RepID=UPI001CA6654C|nr:PDGLE domain-containing protein [Micromonospora sp. PLK6-60]MBY8872443.1 PDGLE domain-containing protein [Micromonospora sp. PLK6-60]